MSIFQGIGALELNKSQLTYRWTIENFGISYKNLNECLTSPVFSTLHLNNATRWQMRLCPQNPSQKYQNYSSIFLDYLSEEKLTASIKFFILDSKKKIVVNETNLGVHVFQSTNTSCGSNYFVNRKNALLQKDKLTIVCEISSDQPLIVPKPVCDASISAVDDQLTVNDYRLEDDLEKLIETEMLGDVTVSIRQTKKLLHKVILASRSEVFRAMFEHDMIEKKSNIVDIVDIRLEVAMEMFRYIYTGRVKDIANMTEELMMAAEKYAITGLKIICEKTLHGNLNFENALRYLTLADMYNTSDLKAQTIEFISTNLNDFVDKPQFKSLDQSILCELFSAVAEKKTKY